jgi:hypothetical protein
MAPPEAHFVRPGGVSRPIFCNSARGRGTGPRESLDFPHHAGLAWRTPEGKNMSVIQSLGTSLPMVLVFFGTLLFSLATAVIALLADY